MKSLLGGRGIILILETNSTILVLGVKQTDRCENAVRIKWGPAWAPSRNDRHRDDILQNQEPFEPMKESLMIFFSVAIGFTLISFFYIWYYVVVAPLVSLGKLLGKNKT